MAHFKQIFLDPVTFVIYVMTHCKAICLDPVTFVTYVMAHCKTTCLDPVTFVIFIYCTLLATFVDGLLFVWMFSGWLGVKYWLPAVQQTTILPLGGVSFTRQEAHYCVPSKERVVYFIRHNQLLKMMIVSYFVAYLLIVLFNVQYLNPQKYYIFILIFYVDHYLCFFLCFYYYNVFFVCFS